MIYSIITYNAFEYFTGAFQTPPIIETPPLAHAQ